MTLSFAVRGQRLEHRFVGPPPAAAPTIVFLHEGLGSAGLWRDFPDRLAAATGCGALVYSRQFGVKPLGRPRRKPSRPPSAPEPAASGSDRPSYLGHSGSWGSGCPWYGGHRGTWGSDCPLPGGLRAPGAGHRGILAALPVRAPGDADRDGGGWPLEGRDWRTTRGRRHFDGSDSVPAVSDRGLHGSVTIPLKWRRTSQCRSKIALCGDSGSPSLGPEVMPSS